MSRYLGLILTFLALVASIAWAQAPALNPDTTVNVELETKLDSKKATVGELVKVKVEQEIKQGDTVLLPKNSYLVGTVTKVEPAQGKAPTATLAVLFTAAQDKKGNVLVAHLRAAIAHISAESSNSYAMTSTPTEMGGSATPTQMTPLDNGYSGYDQANGIPVQYSLMDSDSAEGADLGGEIQSVAGGNFHIDAGTKLQVRILH